MTAGAVRRWILGESIPNQSSLKVLADLARVPPAWLRYGDVAISEKASGGDRTDPVEPWILNVIADVSRLSPSDHATVIALVEILVKRGAKKN